MNLSVVLLLEFFKIGMFAIGGGYATLPFLYQLSRNYNWFSAQDLTQMLAIANIIPGPVGINLASQAGFKADFFWGALMALLGIMIPSLIFVFIISKLLNKFKDNRFVKSIFYILKPASCAMIAAIGFKLLKNAILKPGHLTALATNKVIISTSVDWMALALFLALLVLSLKKKYSPLFYLGMSAFAGILIHIIKSFFLG